MMVDLIRQSRANPIVRRHAEVAVSGVVAGHPDQEARAVGRYVARISQYRHDPHRVELLRAPWYVLQCEVERGLVPQLDCDDLTMLSLAMLGSIGHKTRVRVVSTRPDQRFNHVFGLVWIEGDWRPLDVTRAWLPPGAQAAPVTRHFDLDA